MGAEEEQTGSGHESEAETGEMGMSHWRQGPLGRCTAGETGECPQAAGKRARKERLRVYKKWPHFGSDKVVGRI